MYTRSNIMTIRHFKDFFAAAAKQAGWEKSGSAWIFPRLAGDQCITSVQLQQASHEKKMYVNIGVHIDGVFGCRFDDPPRLDGSHPHVFRREPKEFSHFLDLKTAIDEDQRSNGLDFLFAFLKCFATRARTRQGLLGLENEGLVFIVPPVRSELEQMEPHEI